MKKIKNTLIKPYTAEKELLEIKRRCCDKLPPLEEHHYQVLRLLEVKNERSMRLNMTWFFVQEILRYQKEIKVFRTNHTGDTRGGKSEGAFMCGFLQQHFYNKLLSEGHFDDVDVDLLKQPINITVDWVHANDVYYLDHIRSSFKNNSLSYGEIHFIDEREKSRGGLGSMTQFVEKENFSNIVAKYNIGEHWLYPRGFFETNASYGIHWLIKDVKERLNWGLLYKLSARTTGVNAETFIGWVCFPLHQNTLFRSAYEKKKNVWINRVIEGGGDPRAEMRLEAAKIVSNNPMFATMKSHKSFVLTNDQQLDIIDTLISQGVLRSFNQEERKRIMGTAQLIVKQRLYPDKFVDNEQK